MHEIKESVESDGNPTEQLQRATMHNIVAAATAANARGPQAIHLAICAASAAIEFVANIASSGGDENEAVNKYTVAFAKHLLVAAVNILDSGTMSVAAGPDLLALAFSETQKQFGQSTEEHLQRGIVAAAKEFGPGTEAAAMIAAKRTASRRGTDQSHRLH